MSDLISRSDAVDAVMNTEPCFYDFDTLEPCHKTKDVVKAINNLPSAQPSVPDTNVGDMISRQDAIDAFRKELCAGETESGREYAIGFSGIEKALNALPSANPDLSGYSDRLWKSAYDRGYERCRQDAIDALKEHRALHCNNTPDTFSILSYTEKSRVDELDTAISTLVNLSSAQPDCKNCIWDVCNYNEAISAQTELIRCKDCKHYDGGPCGIVYWYNTANDFCSKGERRTDE